jgi:chromosome segregation ATPase
MSWNYRKFLLAIVPLGLAGCGATPETCAPDRGGFLHSSACLAAGSYEQREQRLQSELERQRETNRAFKKLLVSIEWEKRRTKAKIGAKQSEYEALDQAWRTLRRQLNERSKQNQRLAARIQELENNLKQLQRPVPAPGAKEKQLEDLRRQATLLQQELDAGIYDDD